MTSQALITLMPEYEIYYLMTFMNNKCINVKKKIIES